MKRWSVLAILCAPQFIMVLDTTVMNVSVSQVVSDLGTTLTQLQLAITLYTLVMGSFILLGGRLGDTFGRRRIFGIGPTTQHWETSSRDTSLHTGALLRRTR